MKVEIKNCNNIDNGSIEIKPNILNIKYAINGTGKTTIEKSIEYTINKKDLKELKPFKHKNNEEIIPQVLGIENIKTISVFNEEYINQYVFLENEIIKNSFEIFIRNEKYDNGMKEINNLLANIKETFVNDDTIQQLIENLKKLSECFGKSKNGYSASSSLARGLGNGNKIENIPNVLEDYTEYLKSDLNSKWLKWQFDGKEYLEITNKCPYCATNNINSKRAKIEILNKEYDPKLIEHLNKILDVFNKLNIFFNEEVNKKIIEISKNINGISPEQKNFLIEIKNQVDVLIQKLETVKNIGFISLKDNDKIIDIIKKYKIDMDYLKYLNSSATNKEVAIINKKIDEVLEKAGILQGEINKQRINIAETIKQYDDEINEFLKCAGINYNVKLELDEDKIYRMKFRHNDYIEKIDKPKEYLSYGEKNAFSLILFMYEALKNKSDLIILDDPISSFDKNKKFAILNMLFRGKNSLNNKTVLLLTHDFEPIIDMKYVMPDKFKSRVFFLENNNGILQEKEITKSDIHTFIEIAEENIGQLNENINKLIYIRRLYEIKDNKGLVYHLTSSLFHKRKIPSIKEEHRNMTKNELTSATNEIRAYIPDFDYNAELTKICDKKKMIEIFNSSTNNYEKLQIYRIIKQDESNEDSILKKFINETFHIENDYLFQINPCKYEIIPEYIISKCTKNIEGNEV